MSYPERTISSPNHFKTPAHERFGVAFHHTGLDFDSAVERLCDPAAQVSYHCVISLDGTRCTFIADEHIAWHAGASKFRGRPRCNEFLLGVAFSGDTYEKPLTPDQIASALEWLEPRWTKYGWSMERMTDHRQISPSRKRDLSPPEWDRLHAAIAARFGGPGAPANAG